jgi:hypothetical protein
MVSDWKKVLIGIGVTYLLVMVAFVPFSAPGHYMDDQGPDATRSVCEGDACKRPNPDPVATEQLYSYKHRETTTESRAGSNQYAVLVGISDYPGSGSDLNYCDDDVYDTRDMLIDMGWSATNIHLLIDEQGTNANIDDEIAWMKQQEDENSQVWFHFSGHGSSGYFLTYGSTMSDDHLAAQFNGFESTQRIIVMDTCHAGSFNALDMSNTISIMACQSNQYSYDGMFTPRFVNKFTDSTVSIEDAFDRAKAEVNSATSGRQTPLMWDNVAGDLLIGNRPPVIAPLPDFSADEDNLIVMDLSAYESDTEDSGTALDWLVTDYDVNAISSISGTQSDDDVITLHPVTDYAGTSQIELTLMDSGGQSAKRTTTVTWNPVNDGPTIASLDRTKSTIFRIQSVTFKVFGEDVDDTLSKVKAEVEYSLQGSGEWTPLTGSTYSASHWAVTWTPDIDTELGSYDIRARLTDVAGLSSDWLTRMDLIEIRNNRPTTTSISIPFPSVERARNVTISIQGEDIEDPLEEMTAVMQYKAPGMEFVDGGQAVLVDDHWEALFAPSTEAPLGWYDIRARVTDSDTENSPWLYENGSIEVQNSRPFVTAITPEAETVYRDAVVYLEVEGWDPEDSNIYLMSQVQYQVPDGDGEWVDMSEGMEFSSDHWWAIFQPGVEAMTGDYLFRARLIDTAGAQSDWFVMDGTVEVQNNPPTVITVEMASKRVVRTEELTVYVKGNDVEDEAVDLFAEAELTLRGKEEWSNSSIVNVQWSNAKQSWAVTIRPAATLRPGSYELRTRFIDTDGDPGPWYSPEYPIEIINGPPVINIDYPELINEKAQVTFDGSGSYDPAAPSHTHGTSGTVAKRTAPSRFTGMRSTAPSTSSSVSRT